MSCAIGDESTQKIARSKWSRVAHSQTPRRDNIWRTWALEVKLAPILVWVAPETDPEPSGGGQAVCGDMQGTGVGGKGKGKGGKGNQ